MTRRRLLQAVLAGALVAAAGPALRLATGRARVGVGPAEIAYGSDRCDQCGMIISEARFAATWQDGEQVRRYDDIGCLARGAGARLAAGQGRAYVHDAAHGGWVEAEPAAFVRTPGIRTPMGYGVAAYAERQAATAAHPGVPVLTWAGLVEALGQDHR
jgi:copper chaperone NosL